MMKNKLIIIFVFEFLLFFTNSFANDNSPHALVKVDSVIDIELSPIAWVSGNIISKYDSKISSEVEGRIVDILDVGDFVRKGDVIAKIENTRYKLNYSEIESEIKPIESQLKFYTSEVDRLKKLANNNNAAKNKLEEFESNKDEAIAKIKLIKSRLSSANDLLLRTTIRSPFDGIITERYKSLGERVSDNDVIIRLVDANNPEIQSFVQRSSLDYINVGDAIEIKVNSSIIEGFVTKLIPVADNVSKLYEIRIGFQKNEWPIGASVKIACPINKKQNVLAVPRDALVIRDSRVVVYRVSALNRAEVIPVVTGISNQTHIQIIGDITLDDKIVVRGNERLRPNQQLKIIHELND